MADPEVKRWYSTGGVREFVSAPRAADPHTSALKVVRACAGRAKDVDRMILACFLLGLSTRNLATALLPILGRPVSPATVSAVAKQLDCPVGLGGGSPTLL